MDIWRKQRNSVGSSQGRLHGAGVLELALTDGALGLEANRKQNKPKHRSGGTGATKKQHVVHFG